MSEHSQPVAPRTARLRYRTPEIAPLGSIADITAATGGPGTDSFFGYAETGSVNIPPSS
jgi:hypothetical protein